MKTLPKVDKADWGLVNVEPDPDFDPIKNQETIDRVYKKNMERMRTNERERKEKLGERTSAIASYVKHVVDKKDNTSPEGYFGKRYLTKLRGERIIAKLKDAAKNQETTSASW